MTYSLAQLAAQAAHRGDTDLAERARELSLLRSITLRSPAETGQSVAPISILANGSDRDITPPNPPQLGERSLPRHNTHSSPVWPEIVWPAWEVRYRPFDWERDA